MTAEKSSKPTIRELHLEVRKTIRRFIGKLDAAMRIELLVNCSCVSGKCQNDVK